jgi:hypothetical protein
MKVRDVVLAGFFLVVNPLAGKTVAIGKVSYLLIYFAFRKA